MLTSDQLKPHLLHPHQHVRIAVAEYLSDGWCPDADLMPMVLEACRRYGARRNSLMLFHANRFTLTDASMRELLAFLAAQTDSNVVMHTNRILPHAPPDLLTAFAQDLRDNPNVDRELLPKLERRCEVARWPADRLWQELQDFAHRSETGQYTNEIDHEYVGALIDALAPHDVPDADTLGTMLAAEEFEDGWLDTFLVDLAGARQFADGVPALVEKFHIDTDYLLERCQVALARIADPLAARLIREAWPEADWNFCNYAGSVLGQLKHRDCEEAIFALLQTEDDTDLRTDLCVELCQLFSERGVEVVLREIKTGERSIVADLRHELLPVLDVLGIDHPQKAAWQRELEEEERQLEERRPMLERMLREPPPIHYLPPEPELEPEPSIFDQQLPFQHDRPRVGRNDPCPCGSGKKFKKCCGKK